MRPPIIPKGTATIATSDTTEAPLSVRALNRLSPSQIATATPMIMQSAYRWKVNGPNSNAESVGDGIERFKV